MAEPPLKSLLSLELTNAEIAEVALARFLATTQDYRIYVIRKTLFLGIRNACDKSESFARIATSFFLREDDPKHRGRSYAAIKGLWPVAASRFRVGRRD